VGDLGAGSGEPTLSHGYSAPELWVGHPPTPASDRFALGATLWAIHAGSPPPCALGPARRPTRAEVRGSGLSARDAPKVVGWLEPSPALRPPLEARGPSPRALRRAAAGVAAGVALAAAAAAAWSPPPRCPAGWTGDGLRCSAPDGRQVARVPPGAWVAGVTSADDARWAPDATPTPTSITGAVWFRTTEVTQGEYAALVGHSPQAVRRETLPDGTSSPCSSWEGHPLIDPALPAACVSWSEAVAFANLASAADGLPPAYAVSPTGEVTWRRGAPGWRLPTEAEWEWAARGGPAGQTFAGAEARDALCGFANVRDQSAPEFWGNEVACSDGAPVLAPVGSYQPNALGLYDVLGNVGEWTWDRWGDRDGRPLVDPAGAAAGEARVIRGTGWNQVGRPVSARYAGDPNERGLETGLRLVRDVGWSGGR
jgi:formylglycine-generating enzyme required for sulfatase activity